MRRALVAVSVGLWALVAACSDFAADNPTVIVVEKEGGADDAGSGTGPDGAPSNVDAGSCGIDRIDSLSSLPVSVGWQTTGGTPGLANGALRFKTADPPQSSFIYRRVDAASCGKVVAQVMLAAPTIGTAEVDFFSVREAVGNQRGVAVIHKKGAGTTLSSEGPALEQQELGSDYKATRLARITLDFVQRSFLVEVPDLAVLASGNLPADFSTNLEIRVGVDVYSYDPGGFDVSFSAFALTGTKP